MKINIITGLNGVGLQRDAEVLKLLLEGHEIEVLNSLRVEPGRKADINIFCEFVEPHYIKLAPRNYLFPNPEWFYNRWKIHLPKFTAILCKTRDCEAIFQELHPNALHTSFSSLDRLKAGQRIKEWFHLVGASENKGHIAVKNTWEENPDLAQLTMVQHRLHTEVSAKNITYIHERIDEDALQELQNRNLFHLCPSRYEGFGHYIDEARSCGAIIVTTDAPPMNEFVQPGFGFLVPPDFKSLQNLAIMHDVDQRKLKWVVREAMDLSEDQIAMMRSKSRHAWEDNRKYFKERLLDVIEGN